MSRVYYFGPAPEYKERRRERMSPNEILKTCLKEQNALRIREKSRQHTDADIVKLRKLTAEAKSVCLKLQRKYYIQELNYKTIGASPRAIQANAERRQLVNELLKSLSNYDNDLIMKSVHEIGGKKYLNFTIY